MNAGDYFAVSAVAPISVNAFPDFISTLTNYASFHNFQLVQCQESILEDTPLFHRSGVINMWESALVHYKALRMSSKIPS